ncbi:unnamed protein product [Prunus armeniaca]|uniref:Uncharacterized protein n=1 Tax=Prunus armeniaca TaxID=36596 RepID=A0A6J5WI23_PRUAR|nr:unnamed protein product [Prunus armeniaca]
MKGQLPSVGSTNVLMIHCSLWIFFIYYPVVRAVSEKLGGPVDILHFDAYPDIYNAFEGNESRASSFARIMEGGYARRLLQAYDYISPVMHFSLLVEMNTVLS